MPRLLEQTEMTFPERPYAPFSDRTTSRQAADAIAPHVSRMEGLVLDALRRVGAAGLTDSEIEATTGLGPNTARPRRVGLGLKGLVADSGLRRRTSSGRMAKVWVIA